MVAEKLAADKPDTDNNLTISTKLSTDQLICKSPQTPSPEGSVKSSKHVIPIKDEESNKRDRKPETPIALYFGVLQILFGLLMAVFGVLVLVHNASLSQIGGGLWGGCLATLTGVLGVLSAAKDCCPLKTNPQKIALTAFLALSLISLAVANLVLVLAAIGLARDANRTDEFENDDVNNDLSLSLPANYSALLSSSGLLLISACEVIAAAVSAYHCSRVLCSCFKSPGDEKECECGNGSTVYSASVTGKDLLVSSWLGKQQISTGVHGVQPVYVVTTNNRKRVAPVMYPIPTPPSSLLAPQLVGYPLIPAPLGTTPPPFLHTHAHLPPEKIHRKRRRYPSDHQLKQQVAKPQEKPKKQKKKEKQKTITEEEVAKTYTGLDRVIAEEFIEICDSAKNTSCSDTSGCTGSDTTSNEFISEKL